MKRCERVLPALARLSAGPGPGLTLAEFLRRLTGEFSYVWDVPLKVREDWLPRLVLWAEQTFDLDIEVPMPRELRWTIFVKDAV